MLSMNLMALLMDDVDDLIFLDDVRMNSDR